MLIILSTMTWFASVFLGFLGYGAWLNSKKKDGIFPRPVYLTLCAVLVTASFSIFYSLGGPRQW